MARGKQPSCVMCNSTLYEMMILEENYIVKYVQFMHVQLYSAKSMPHFLIITSQWQYVLEDKLSTELYYRSKRNFQKEILTNLLYFILLWIVYPLMLLSPTAPLTHQDVRYSLLPWLQCNPTNRYNKSIF